MRNDPRSMSDFGQDPDPFEPLEKEGKSRGCIIAVIVTLVLVVGGGLGGCFVLYQFGMNILGEQVVADIEDNPVILEHLGTIEEIDIDLTATAAESDDDVLVFEVTGTKGEGRLVVQTWSTDDAEEVQWGMLRLPSGEKIPLFPDQGEKPR